MTLRGVIALMAMVEIAALQPMASYPALVPLFIDQWGLSNAAAGWIGGIYYLGYMLAVPFLVALTDRMDARRVLVFGCLVSALANFGFALAADGFWSALGWRALAGLGLAGVYMPGLRALTDRIGGADKSRAITLYTSSYSVGVGISFLLTGAVNDIWGWRWAFAAAGIAPLLSLVLAWRGLDMRLPAASMVGRALFDFRPVFRNRAAMGYILAYGAHGFELMAMRGWITAYLGFVATRSSADGTFGATLVAALITFIGLPASIFGNEMAIRFGRRRVITTIMLASAATALLIGLAAEQSYFLVLALCLFYGFVVTADSGSITSGTMAVADPVHQGATMAVHSTIGFAACFLGPLAVGIALDLAGGESAFGWATAFAVMAAGAAMGPVALRLFSDRTGSR